MIAALTQNTRVKNFVESDTGRFAAYLAISIITYFIFKVLLLMPAKKDYNLPWLWLGTSILAFAGHNFKITDLDTCSRYIVRTVFVVFAVYTLWAYPTTLLENLNIFDRLTLGPGRYLATICLVVAMWRPSFALVGLSYAIWYKAGLSRILGTRISYTDYTPLLEMALFIIIAQLLLPRLARFKYWTNLDKQGTTTILSAQEKICLFAIATHFSNYFYSGYKKLWLGDHIWTWTTQNDTQNLILNAWELGQLPISFSPALTAWTYQMMAAAVVPSNILIQLGQLLAIVAIFRIRWALWITLFYDITHIVIYIASGIFFYKWIFLNFSIIAGLRTLIKKDIPLGLGAALAAMILIAPNIFFVAKLGWWDTPAINVERIYAVDKKGNEYAIPTNFWGSFSVHLAQGRMSPGKDKGFLPTLAYGTVFGMDNVRRAKACDYDLAPGTVKIDLPRQQETEKFFHDYHAWMLHHNGSGTPKLYDLYPHHIFSFPWDFAEFNGLNLGDVVTYRYKVTATCLSLEDGKLQQKILKTGYHDIPVTNP